MILSEKLFETLDDDTFDALQDRLEKAYYFPGVDGNNLAVKLIMKKKHIDELKGKQPARLIANSISKYRPIKDKSELDAAKKIADEFGLKSEIKEFNGRLYLTIKLDESLNEDTNNFDLMSEIINDPDTEKYKNRRGSYSYRTVGPLRWYLLKCGKAGIDPVQTDEFKWEAKGPNYEFEYVEGDVILTPTKSLKEDRIPRNATKITGDFFGDRKTFTKKNNTWHDGKSYIATNFLRNHLKNSNVDEIDKDYKPTKMKNIIVLQGK